MYRNKFLSVVFFAAIAACVVVAACKKDDKPDPEAEGKKAGTEMCNCVSDIPEPVIPNLPQGVNPLDPDYTDPATLQWLAAVQAVYEAYFAELGNCAGGVAGKYQKYFGMEISKYDEENPDFFSVFDFKDEDFQKGFLEAAMVCAEAFSYQ
jgi:hypothetical protein